MEKKTVGLAVGNGALLTLMTYLISSLLLSSGFYLFNDLFVLPLFLIPLILLGIEFLIMRHRKTKMPIYFYVIGYLVPAIVFLILTKSTI